MTINNELLDLEKKLELLAKRKEELLEQQKLEAERSAKLDKLLEESEYGTAKELVEALVQKFNVRISLISTSATSGKRRKRTKVTADLRDKVKGAVAEGYSKNQVSKNFEISYAVVNKIVDGAYDAL
ncbi:MAG: hypothetical protein MK080_03160 [Opitutales bacterium]|nr:hypothetical protein [Opitutales bacterium]